MNHQLNRLSAVMLLAFVAVAAALGYWAILRRPAVLTREDNPRLIDAKRQIARGNIEDRDGRTLARSEPQPNGTYRRSYPHPSTASAVGYYSLRYGVSGVEAAYDPVLRGTPYYNEWDRLLHRPQVGGDVRLTLDQAVQRTAAEALEGKAGAVVVVEVSTGAVLALASSPTFDPNTLDEQWDALTEDPDAPLLNRATQARYQPGAALQTVVLAAALEAGALSAFDPEDAAAPVALRFDGDTITLRCAETPDAPLEDFFDAYAYACPAPFIQIGEALGADALAGAFAHFGLEIPEAGAEIEDAVGQGALTVSPAQMVRVMAAVVSGGEMPALYLVSHTRAPGGEWEPEPMPPAQPVMAPETARQLFKAMPAYAEGAIIGHAGTARSGPEGKMLAWFAGTDGHYAVVAVVENVAGLHEAIRASVAVQTAWQK